MGRPDGEQEGTGPGPSSKTRAFIARRDALNEAAAAVEAVEADRRARQTQRQHAEYHNPLALLGGLVVLVLLLAGFVFVLDSLSGDPWYADCPRTATGNCR
jgi:hypothetical protein